MKSSRHLFGVILLFFALINPAKAQNDRSQPYHEQYRPQVHFSPQQHWMNDPNGMIYFDHTYHLFFQYYPGATVWGPMHWGHAVSSDLIHWKELGIALFPDSLGYIFSGSAVADSNNTSGFGKNGKIPLVAIFTHHDPNGEKQGRDNYQNESLAYSLDEGNTWTKYPGNPVLKNPGIKDFRDPKVMWYAPQHKWLMTLATKDHITFYSSPNLKSWHPESEFGKELGAHGGVWECPDLFPLKLNDRTYWILIVNLNPGGPNGGSGTQYFVGQFDGNKFVPVDTKIRWLDYGPDEYAGVTFNNTGASRIFLGWMSNWLYAAKVPTVRWRNAMTIPRELKLENVNGEVMLTSEPRKELAVIEQQSLNVNKELLKGDKIKVPAQFSFKADISVLSDYSLVLSDEAGEKLVFGYSKADNRYYIDRSKSGKTDFDPAFSKTAYAPRIRRAANSNIRLVADASSIEIFCDDGSTVLTCVFFPTTPFNQLQLKSTIPSSFKNVVVRALKPIW